MFTQFTVHNTKDIFSTLKTALKLQTHTVLRLKTCCTSIKKERNEIRTVLCPAPASLVHVCFLLKR